MSSCSALSESTLLPDFEVHVLIRFPSHIFGPKFQFQSHAFWEDVLFYPILIFSSTIEPGTLDVYRLESRIRCPTWDPDRGRAASQRNDGIDLLKEKGTMKEDVLPSVREQAHHEQSSRC